MIKIGDRVFAIQKANAKEVYFLGYGKYIGETVPPENVGGLNLGLPNPTIKLDSGENVYGCECWWGSESAVEKIIGERKIISVLPERA